MKLENNSYVRGFLRCGLRPSSVWRIICDELDRIGVLATEYVVSAGMDRTSGFGGALDYFLRPDEIAEKLDALGESIILKVEKRPYSGRSGQRFVYSVDHGLFTIYLDRCDFPPDIDDLVGRLFDKLPLVNCLCTRCDYLRSLRKFRKAGNTTSLVLAPGETNFRDGFIEGVSSEMWLGSEFWRHASCGKEDLLRMKLLKYEERESHLHVIAWPRQFDSAEGKQGEIQRDLLRLIFGIE